MTEKNPEKIPLHRIPAGPRQAAYLAQALQSGRLHGDGPMTARCVEQIAAVIGTPHVLLTPSCTAALELACILAEVGTGDEVIMPAFTFVSAANAVCLRGAKPVFVDIREDTLNLDERLVAASVTPRTRAIMPVHYAGVACDMAALVAIARSRGLLLIEDAAHAFGSFAGGEPLGTVGDIGCYSFHDTKNFPAGEAGAIVVRDAALFERARIVREKGTNRSAVLRGTAAKYEWQDIGSSFLASDLTAALLLAQIEERDAITAGRRRVFAAYDDAFAPLFTAGLLRGPVVPPGCDISPHIYYLLTQTAAEQRALIAHLVGLGVHAAFHYLPLNKSPYAQRMGFGGADLPVTESVAGRLLRLPLYPDLSDSELARVIAAVRGYFGT